MMDSYQESTNSLRHVLMPNGPEIRIRIAEEKKLRCTVIKECWQELKLKVIVCEHYEEVKLFDHLKICLIAYNPKLQFGNFNILEDLCTFIAHEECDTFCLKNLLLNIIEIADELPLKFPEPIPLLFQNKPNSVRISQNQATCLLANAFLCTFPKREAIRGNNGLFANYPRINFNELYDDTYNSGDRHSWRGRARSAKLEKLKCLMSYFKRCIERRELSLQRDESEILFERKVLQAQEFISWEHCNQPLLKLQVFSAGAIEDAEGRLQVDFANEFVGGGTLGNGSAMEEIRFITCPELIVSQLFTECLNDNEALVISGFEQFTTYIGYGSSFQFAGDYEQDPNLRHQLVVLDALRFSRNSRIIQYKRENVDRELHKCLIGFKSNENDVIPQSPRGTVASGKWGCGVFNGDPELKSIIQWMATSTCHKNLELYTFGDADLTHKLNSLALLTRDHGITVDFMYKAINKFGKILQKDERNRKSPSRSFINFLKSEIVPIRTERVPPVSSKGNDTNEYILPEVLGRDVTRTEQPRPHELPQFSENLDAVSSSSNSCLVPAQNSASGCSSNAFLCRSKAMPLITYISEWVVKIPGWNRISWISRYFSEMVQPLCISMLHISKSVLIGGGYFLLLLWGRLIKPAARFILKTFALRYQKFKMIFQNIQAVSTPNVRDREKEELDLSDSD